jgi:hypothetical protein
VPWLSEFTYCSYRALGSATARDVACLLVGVVRLRMQPGETPRKLYCCCCCCKCLMYVVCCLQSWLVPCTACTGCCMKPYIYVAVLRRVLLYCCCVAAAAGARWLQRVAVEAHHRLPSMTPTELTNTLLCLARLKAAPNAAFMATFCSCSSRLLHRTASVAGAVAAGGGLGAAAAAGRQLLAGHSSSSSSSSNTSIASSTSPSSTAAAAADLYCPQTLGNTLGAMAKLRYQPPRAWSRAFLAASQQLLPAFRPRDFSFTIWGLAQLDLQPQPQWLDLYLVQLRQHVPTMDSAQLSATIWALAMLGHRPGVDWMQRFLDRVVALSGSTQQQQQLDRHASSSRAAAAAGAAGGAAVAGRRRRLAGVTAHAAAAAAAAPPSALQLSTDFSSIILHGLTMWAVARLDYQMPGSRSTAASSSSSSVPEGELVLARSMTNSVEVVGHAAGSNGSSLSGAPVAVHDAAPSSVDGVGGMVTSISRDGSIVFHF